MNWINHNILWQLVQLRAKYGNGHMSLPHFNLDEARKLAEWVYSHPDPDWAVNALSAATQYAAGGTKIDDLISASEDFYDFCHEPMPVTLSAEVEASIQANTEEIIEQTTKKAKNL